MVSEMGGVSRGMASEKVVFSREKVSEMGGLLRAMVSEMGGLSRGMASEKVVFQEDGL